jgi:hypothetical protein
MRTMLKVTIPAEGGNKGVKEGSLTKAVMAFVEQHKPEAAYFTPTDGKRCALFVFDLKDPSHMPSITEPFYQGFNAEISFQPVMNAEDLKAGLERLPKH